MKKVEVEIEKIIESYLSGNGFDKICKDFGIGKKRVRQILEENNIEIRKPSSYSLKRNFVVEDYTKKKFEDGGDYYFVAVSKIDGKTFNDIENKGGHLTSYIRDVVGVEIPSLYERRVYYQTTGNYWWEQWFDVEKREFSETKKCPYCNFETKDVNNESGVFERHLLKKHEISIEDYLLSHPEDFDYFKNFKEKVNRLEKLKIENNYTICPLCNERFSRITLSHVRMHEMELEEFKKRFPDVKMLSVEQKEKAVNSVTKGNLSVSKNRFISKYEKEIQQFLKDNNVDFSSNRQLLIGKEIGILVESKKIGIEFDDLKWQKN